MEVTGASGVSTITADKILVSTGSRAQLLPFIEGVENSITSDHALVLDPQPNKIIIYGAG